jgi:hypothetical protein
MRPNLGIWVIDIQEGRGMSDYTEKPGESDTKFTLGVAELRAKSAPAPVAEPQTVEIVHEDRGVDPYNTSGSFDRNKNWSRVGKR